MPRIGLISDTHGLLRPEAERFLRGCDHIVHAGDIDRPEILHRLAALAPVTAVRGNNDRGPWVDALRVTEFLTVHGIAMFVLHDLGDLAHRPPPAGTQVIVCGHSHRPSVVRHSGVLVVNPGSAGPRRFKLPVTAAELLVSGDDDPFSARVVELL